MFKLKFWEKRKIQTEKENNYCNNNSETLKSKLESFDWVSRIDEPSNRTFFVVYLKTRIDYGKAKREMNENNIGYSVGGSKTFFYVYKIKNFNNDYIHNDIFV